MLRQKKLEAFNEALERTIGFKIGIKYIQSDKKGVLKCIPAGSLYRGKPLILSHFVGALMVFLPSEDYQDLLRGKVAPQEYIDNSVWHFGYLWSFANVCEGVFWETLENGKPGIHQIEKIRRYLTIMQCRTYQHQLGKQAFDKSKCAQCKYMKCPMSPLPIKYAGSNLENEFGDYKMRRFEFYKTFARHIMERFELNVNFVFIDDRIPKNAERVYVAPSFSPKTVKLIVSQEMFVDMMYNPEKYDVEEMLQRYALIATTQVYNDKSDEISFPKTMAIGQGMTLTDLNRFWHNNPCDFI